MTACEALPLHAFLIVLHHQQKGHGDAGLGPQKAAVGPMKIEGALRDLQTRSDKYPHHIMCLQIFQARRSGEEELVEYKSLFESLVYFFLEVTPFPLGQLEQHDT